ncbi:MAG: hypothetical protein WBA23_15490, partial [Tunicatimonas sp.]|uniref:hypothetical protein n=1 Tax=Tunicatimonas sp. TaxID=1940096 RepID=UPI003C741B07
GTELSKDSILSLHFEKVGGIDQWKQLRSYYVKQSSFFAPAFLPPHKRSLGDQSIGYKNVFCQWPNLQRVEMYDNNGQLGRAFVTTHNEAKMYDYNLGKEHILPEEFSKEVLYNSSLHHIGATLHLLRAHEKDSIEYNGEIVFGGKRCHMFRINIYSPSTSNTKLVIYLDVDTYLIHATSNTKSIEKHKIYSDYQNVDGFVVPHTNVSYDKGVIFEEYKILKTEINSEVDNLLFEIW